MSRRWRPRAVGFPASAPAASLPVSLRTAVAEKLTDLGFRNVADYEEGLPAWKGAGLPIEETAA